MNDLFNRLGSRAIRTAFLCSMSVLVLGVGSLQAQNIPLGSEPVNPSTRPDQTVPANRKALALADQMASPRFAERRRAIERLRQMGKAAHPVLGKVVETGDPDSASNALDLLRQASESADSDLRASATETLQRIASSDSPMADAARKSLQPAEQVPPRPGQLPGMLPGIPQPRPQFAPRRRTNLRISIRTANGVRDVEVTENDRTFRFRDNGQSLDVERPDGQGGTTKKSYQGVDDLKKQDPEAYEAHKKAGGQQLRLQQNRTLMPLIPGLPPGMFRGPGIRPPGDRRPTPRESAPPQQDGPRIELHPGVPPSILPDPVTPPKSPRVEV
ncbi:hypothetical protein FYK55_17600 [Roseiconus nitratireducens]|uniref:HEAT repeat protein n=1 Tax=Roseiconus nitratireducens TaxID=2605748 RepID=A0A5M6D3B6_9BACT|nr:hypothetical protein [Roseiconus nitratireducens]KAA5541386.1 hypothetical protein FYK55_17600 [Roseiconus nitratireducens]